MPLRFPCLPASLTPASPLVRYWGAGGLHRPLADVWLIGPGSQIAVVQAQLDTAADYNLLEAGVANTFGLTLPFPRRLAMSGAAGTQAATVSFSPDGLISLFVTDYREYCYLPGPLIGFHPPGPQASSQRSVLGLTGFLQYFRFILDHGPSPPAFELHPLPSFPGQSGPLPRDRPLQDFLRGLRFGP